MVFYWNPTIPNSIHNKKREGSLFNDKKKGLCIQGEQQILHHPYFLSFLPLFRIKWVVAGWKLNTCKIKKYILTPQQMLLFRYPSSLFTFAVLFLNLVLQSSAQKCLTMKKMKERIWFGGRNGRKAKWALEHTKLTLMCFSSTFCTT